jgi:hypothetical protein
MLLLFTGASTTILTCYVEVRVEAIGRQFDSFCDTFRKVVI